MKPLLLIFLLMQAEETIPRADKKLYFNAARECERAAGLVKSSPSKAVEILTTLLENKEIEKRECILRIEMLPGTIQDFSFFPYQVRGRAWERLANKAGDDPGAVPLLEKARKDFKESVERGQPKSRASLQRVEKILAARTQPKPDKPPEPEFSEDAFSLRWDTLVGEKKFAQALQQVMEEGTGLSEKRREFYRAKTELECHQFVSKAVRTFQENLEKLENLEAIRLMKDFVFERRFALPTGKELIKTPPTYPWSLSVRETLRKFLEGREVLDDFFRLAIEALALDREARNLRFQSMEHFAGTIVATEIRACGAAASEAPLVERKELRKRVETFRKKWEAFESALEKAVRKRGTPVNRYEPPRLDATFPVDWKGAAGLSSDLHASAREEDPDLSLKNIADQLALLRKKPNNWSIESRRSLLRFQIAVEVIRGTLSGKNSAKIIQEQLSRGIELKRLGGSFDGKEFGPKVQRVFDTLGKP